VRIALGVFLVWMLWRTGLVAPERVLAAFVHHPGWIALALFAHALVFVILGVRWAIVSRAAGFPVGMGLGGKLSFVSHFFSTVLPGNGAGDLVKAWIASQQDLSCSAEDTRLRNADGSYTEVVTRRPTPMRMSLSQALGTMVPDRLAGMAGLFSAWFLCQCLCLAARPDRLPLLAPFLVASLAGALAFLGVLFFLPTVSRWLAERSERTRYAAFLRPLREGLATLEGCGASRSSLAKAVVLSLTAQVFFFGAAWACSQALERGVSYLTLGAAMPLVAFSNSIPVSPGGLGVGEGVAAAALRALGHEPEAGAEVMFLLRLVLWGLAMTGFVFWLSLRGRELPQEKT
jgi:uncharacterized membrane protein YbhN (UPF0104 family)